MNSEISNGYWRVEAACLKADPELFFPTGETSGPDRKQIDAAKLFCVSCLVKAQCLEYAMETHQDTGVWGGLTEKERKLAVRRSYYRSRTQ